MHLFESNLKLVFAFREKINYTQGVILICCSLFDKKAFRNKKNCLGGQEFMGELIGSQAVFGAPQTKLSILITAKNFG